MFTTWLCCYVTEHPLYYKTKGITSSSTVYSYLQQATWADLKSQAALSDSQVPKEGLFETSYKRELHLLRVNTSGRALQRETNSNFV